MKNIAKKKSNQKSPKSVAPAAAKPVATQPAPAQASLFPKPVAQPAAPKTPVPAKPAEATVTFTCDAPHARHVSVYGDFDNWAAYGTPMKQHAGGQWTLTLALKPGRHVYKFNVDGKWMHDPKAKETVADGFGALNSVIHVKA